MTGLLPWLNLLPGLAGVFIGAPLVAREVEDGTWRLAWSQGVTRRAWLRGQRAIPAMGATLVGYLAIRLPDEYTLRLRYLPPAKLWGVPFGASPLPRRVEHRPGPTAHGYTQMITYQPAGRFWIFQGMEAGGCLLLAAVAVALAYRLVLSRYP
jgi:hypothetical protein